MDTFFLLKLLSHLVLPPASMVAGLVAGSLLFVGGMKRLGKAIAIGAVIETALLCLPPIADMLIEPLEQKAREAATLAAPCCYAAIVVLGGGVSPATPPAMPLPHLIDGADRIWYAAQLFHRGTARKIIVSGGDVRSGVPTGNDTEATAMGKLLVELGVPAQAIVVESASRNTRENVAYMQAIVADEPVALVTSAYHMPRALRLARHYGLNAFAFPTDYRIPAAARPTWRNWLPGTEAETTASYAIWEYTALALDWRQ
jgi:uncharacterized SAM-binding protein YcdF (DUF218 family)